MDIQQLESEAHANALLHVVNMLERPDQLEKVNQFKQRVTRKKNSVEAMLKTAMQSQLDDVKLGLNQLQSALKDIEESRQSLSEIESALEEVPGLLPQFSELREVSRLHQQYEAAVCTMDFTLTIDKFVERAQKVMDQGSLLAAHKYLIELERTRDRLLMDLLRKLGGQSSELERLKAHFSEVEALSDRLGKQLWLKLSRTLTTVRREPQEIVTVLRIVEREEQADLELKEHAGITDYVPPGRPKRWKHKTLQVMEDAVNTRIDANAFEGREDNKLWLVRHLEICRLLVLDDLTVVKRHCGVCFPAHYDIFNTYVQMYHQALSKHLMETISGGLEGNEYFTLLSWARNTYLGVDLLSHPDLRVDTGALTPLLDQLTIQKLVDDYLQEIESNYQEWLGKAMEQETEDWHRDTVPELEGEHYHTTAPLIVFQMVDQNLQVAKSVSDDFAMHLLAVSLAQITKFSNLYRNSVISYKTQHFVDRSKTRYFTHYMIAIVNNCEVLVEMARQTKDRYWKKDMDDHGSLKALEVLVSTYQKLRDDCIGFLLEEVSLDLDVHFAELLTRAWLTSPEAVNTICATVEDYCCDYVHLRRDCFERTVAHAANMLYVRYLTAVLQKRIALKSGEERRDCADKMAADAKQIHRTLARFLSDGDEDQAPIAVLNSMSEVVRVQDVELLTLELHGLLRLCPDASSDQLTALLLLRGDLGRLDIRQRVQELMETVTAPAAAPSVLAQVQVQSSVFSIT